MKYLIIVLFAAQLTISCTKSKPIISEEQANYVYSGMSLGVASSGELGYGVRDNAGTMQFKNNGGVWQDVKLGGCWMEGTTLAPKIKNK